jgi:hypothetical protein
MSLKRPGAQQYSSDGYHLSVEMEADIEDDREFRRAASALFAEVKAALEAEMVNGSPQVGRAEGRADLWGGSGNRSGGNGGRRRRPGAQASRRGRSADRTAAGLITDRQVRFLSELAERAGMDAESEVAGWIREKLGVEKGVRELTKAEASRAIDLLNNGSGDVKKRRPNPASEDGVRQA